LLASPPGDEEFPATDTGRRGIKSSLSKPAEDRGVRLPGMTCSTGGRIVAVFVGGVLGSLCRIPPARTNATATAAPDRANQVEPRRGGATATSRPAPRRRRTGEGGPSVAAAARRPETMAASSHR